MVGEHEIEYLKILYLLYNWSSTSRIIFAWFMGFHMFKGKVNYTIYVQINIKLPKFYTFSNIEESPVLSSGSSKFLLGD